MHTERNNNVECLEHLNKLHDVSYLSRLPALIYISKYIYIYIYICIYISAA